MIIDSKVPLAGYEWLIAAGEQAERAASGDQFVRDVKAISTGSPASGTRRTRNWRRTTAC